MTERSDAEPDLHEQLARLRRDVEALIAERTPPHIAAAAREGVDAAQAQLDSLAARIRERPLVAVVAAAGLGYVLARLLRR